MKRRASEWGGRCLASASFGCVSKWSPGDPGELRKAGEHIERGLIYRGVVFVCNWWALNGGQWLLLFRYERDDEPGNVSNNLKQFCSCVCVMCACRWRAVWGGRFLRMFFDVHSIWLAFLCTRQPFDCRSTCRSPALTANLLTLSGCTFCVDCLVRNLGSCVR